MSWLIIRPFTLRKFSHACQNVKWAPLNEKQVVINKTCLGYVKCIVAMAGHNAILKNWCVPTKFSYHSSISSLNNIRGTKLKLKLLSLFGQICKCSNLYVHNY